MHPGAVAAPQPGNPSGQPNGNWAYANYANQQAQNAAAPPAQTSPGNMYGNVGAYTPLPYQAFGAIPQITPQQIQPGDITNFLDPYASAVGQGMQPLFQQQQEGLNSDLASRGIYNSGAANASQGNLLAQQFGEVLQGALPYAQQDITGNVNSQNQAIAANAAAYGNVAQGNQQTYNNWQQELFGANQQRGNTLQDAYLQSYAPNNTLIGQGLNQAGNAYTNTYNQGVAGAGQLGGQLAGAAGSYFGNMGGGAGGAAGTSAFGSDYAAVPQTSDTAWYA